MIDVLYNLVLAEKSIRFHATPLKPVETILSHFKYNESINYIK